MQIFLPPKEGKVRQSQGRAEANNFAFSHLHAKTDFRIHRDPLDHLSVDNVTHQKTLNLEGKSVFNWKLIKEKRNCFVR